MFSIILKHTFSRSILKCKLAAQTPIVLMYPELGCFKPEINKKLNIFGICTSQFVSIKDKSSDYFSNGGGE